MPSHRRRPPPAAGLVCLAALLAATGAAQAQTVEVTGAVTAQIEAPEQDSYFESQAIGPVSGSATAFQTGPTETPVVSAESRAEADYGRLRVVVEGTAQGPSNGPFDGLAAGSGGALFEDYVTIVPSNPGLQDTPGTARVRVRVSGIVSADSGGALDSLAFADYFARVRFGLRNCFQFTECADAATGVSHDRGSLGGGQSFEGTPLPAVLDTVSLPFFFGQPFLLGVELSATLQADADIEPLTAVAVSQLGSTLEWGGFVEVRGQGGELVEDYETESLTGIDWRRPVPEPQGGGAGAATIAALACARRQRGRS